MQRNTLSRGLSRASLGVYRNRTVLVTGHTGFVGSWLCLWLKQLGARVVGYALDPPTEPSLFETVALDKRIDRHVIGDVRDSRKLCTVLQDCEPEYVFHLAAQPIVRLSYAQPRQTFETNVLGTVNVLEAIRMTPSVRTAVIVTSDKCYQNREWVYGYRETDRLGGRDPYSSSKACTELVVDSYRQSFFDDGGPRDGVAIATARAGNIIGGGDWGEDRLLPDCVRALSQGHTISIRNPNALRPWQFVLEPVSGYLWLAALLHSRPSEFAGAWNFGPRHDLAVTVEQLVQMFLDCWGDGDYEIERIDAWHEAGLLRLDTSKANASLAWRPTYSIYDAIRQTASWYQEFYDSRGAIALDRTLSQIEEYAQAARAKCIPWGEEDLHALSNASSQTH